MQTTCIMSVRKHNLGYFISTTVQLPDGKTKYFTDMTTKERAEEFAKEYNITIEVIS